MISINMEKNITAVLAATIEDALGARSPISTDISRIEINWGLIEVTFSLVLNTDGYSPRSADRHVTIELNSTTEDAQFKAELRRKFVGALGLDRLAEEFAPRFAALR